MPSCEHMRTPFDFTLSYLHLQTMEACSIVLTVAIFRTDVPYSQYRGKQRREERRRDHDDDADPIEEASEDE